MVERSLDKTIRVLRELLKPSSNTRIDGDGISHESAYLDTHSVQIPHELLLNILEKNLKLVVGLDSEIPIYEGNGPTSNYSGEYVVEVIIENEDKNRLASLLKEYEKQLPKRKKPAIREKTLELIARKIGDLDSGNNLVNFLRNCGVDEELIVYPNTKWRMIYDVLAYLANSNKEADREVLSKIIGEATHPLMHDGNEGSALVLRKQFDEFLKYDNMGIAYGKDTGTYWALPKMDEDESNIQAQITLDEEIEHYEKQSEKQLAFLSQPENKEKISLLRKAYRLLMNVVFFFCGKPSNPTVELNDNFQYLFKLINKTINELRLSQVDKSPFSRNEHFFYLPFNNLFAAEKVYREQGGGELSWENIRPEMNAMYGDIEGLYQEVSGSDVLAEPDKQKKLNDIQLYLSELKERTKELREKEQKKEEESNALPIKIVGETAIKISGFRTPSFTKHPENNPSELYLNTVGDLWREPKVKYCYPMDERSDRHKIFRYLATNEGYQQTADISSALEGKSEQSIRTEIGKIRGNIKKYLKIDGKEIVEEGRKGSGYRIGSKYKITIKRE